jgi:tetratricopeptide (TPR) repeat protein
MHFTLAEQRLLAEAVAQGDPEPTIRAGLEILRQGAREPKALQVVDLLLAKALQSQPQRPAQAVAAVARRLQEAAVLDSPGVWIAVGTALHEVGLRRDAIEKWRKALELDNGNYEAARLLAIAELQLALAAPLADDALVVSRWASAWSSLSRAVADVQRFAAWAKRRCDVYAVAFNGPLVLEGLKRIEEIALAAVSQAADDARAAGHASSADALAKLAQQFQADQTALHLFRIAAEEASEGSSEQVSPFGLHWYRTHAPQPKSVEMLQQAIDASHATPTPTLDPEFHDPSARVLGIALRQWYSRFAPVRHAIRWGQFEVANQALQNLCSVDAECEPNPTPFYQPHRPKTPRCCSPACAGFETCNPGYARSDHPARDMEDDLHRIGLLVHVALAGKWIAREPPVTREAAGHWMQARDFAEAVGEMESFEELLTSQVISRVIALREQPQWADDILQRAIAVAPSGTLRARFADRLTDQGLEFCEQGSWDDGAHRLRLSWSLNRQSARTARNLGFALQQLAVEKSHAGDFGEVRSVLEELRSHVKAVSGKLIPEEEMSPLQQWIDDNS